MSELNKVWVTDTRKKDAEPFLYPEHLLKHSKYLKKASRPVSQQRVRVTEPATQATPPAESKKKK